MSSNTGDTKSLHVVFERKKLLNDIDHDYEFVRRPRDDYKTKDLDKPVAKRLLQRKLDAMRGDHLRKGVEKDVTITNLIKAIKDSHDIEEAVTDKFVNNVKCMMSRFNNDLDKLQKIYNNVLNRLPKL